MAFADDDSFDDLEESLLVSPNISRGNGGNGREASGSDNEDGNDDAGVHCHGDYGGDRNGFLGSNSSNDSPLAPAPLTGGRGRTSRYFNGNDSLESFTSTPRRDPDESFMESTLGSTLDTPAKSKFNYASAMDELELLAPTPAKKNGRAADAEEASYKEEVTNGNCEEEQEDDEESTVVPSPESEQEQEQHNSTPNEAARSIELPPAPQRQHHQQPCHRQHQQQAMVASSDVHLRSWELAETLAGPSPDDASRSSPLTIRALDRGNDCHSQSLSLRPVREEARPDDEDLSSPLNGDDSGEETCPTPDAAATRTRKEPDAVESFERSRRKEATMGAGTGLPVASSSSLAEEVARAARARRMFAEIAGDNLEAANCANSSPNVESTASKTTALAEDSWPTDETTRARTVAALATALAATAEDTSGAETVTSNAFQNGNNSKSCRNGDASSVFRQPCIRHENPEEESPELELKLGFPLDASLDQFASQSHGGSGFDEGNRGSLTVNDADLSMEVERHATDMDAENAAFRSNGHFLQGSENRIDDADMLAAMVGVVVKEASAGLEDTTPRSVKEDDNGSSNKLLEEANEAKDPAVQAKDGPVEFCWNDDYLEEEEEEEHATDGVWNADLDASPREQEEEEQDAEKEADDEEEENTANLSFITDRRGRGGRCVKRGGRPKFCPPLNYYDGDCKSTNSGEGDTAAFDHSKLDISRDVGSLEDFMDSDKDEGDSDVGTIERPEYVERMRESIASYFSSHSGTSYSTSQEEGAKDISFGSSATLKRDERDSFESTETLKREKGRLFQKEMSSRGEEDDSRETHDGKNEGAINLSALGSDASQIDVDDTLEYVEYFQSMKSNREQIGTEQAHGGDIDESKDSAEGDDKVDSYELENESETMAEASYSLKSNHDISGDQKLSSEDEVASTGVDARNDNNPSFANNGASHAWTGDANCPTKPTTVGKLELEDESKTELITDASRDPEDKIDFNPVAEASHSHENEDADRVAVKGGQPSGEDQVEFAGSEGSHNVGSPTKSGPTAKANRASFEDQSSFSRPPSERDALIKMDPSLANDCHAAVPDGSPPHADNDHTVLPNADLYQLALARYVKNVPRPPSESNLNGSESLAAETARDKDQKDDFVGGDFGEQGQTRSIKGMDEARDLAEDEDEVKSSQNIMTRAGAESQQSGQLAEDNLAPTRPDDSTRSIPAIDNANIATHAAAKYADSPPKPPKFETNSPMEEESNSIAGERVYGNDGFAGRGFPHQPHNLALRADSGPPQTSPSPQTQIKASSKNKSMNAKTEARDFCDAVIKSSIVGLTSQYEFSAAFGKKSGENQAPAKDVRDAVIESPIEDLSPTNQTAHETETSPEITSDSQLKPKRIGEVFGRPSTHEPRVEPSSHPNAGQMASEIADFPTPSSESSPLEFDINEEAPLLGALPEGLSPIRKSSSPHNSYGGEDELSSILDTSGRLSPHQREQPHNNELTTRQRFDSVARSSGEIRNDLLDEDAKHSRESTDSDVSVESKQMDSSAGSDTTKKASIFKVLSYPIQHETMKGIALGSSDIQDGSPQNEAGQPGDHCESSTVMNNDNSSPDSYPRSDNFPSTPDSGGKRKSPEDLSSHQQNAERASSAFLERLRGVAESRKREVTRGRRSMERKERILYEEKKSRMETPMPAVDEETGEEPLREAAARLPKKKIEGKDPYRPFKARPVPTSSIERAKTFSKKATTTPHLKPAAPGENPYVPFKARPMPRTSSSKSSAGRGGSKRKSSTAFRPHPAQNKSYVKSSALNAKPPKRLLSGEDASIAGEMRQKKRLQEEEARIKKDSAFKARPLPTTTLERRQGKLAGEDLLPAGKIIRIGKENTTAFAPRSSIRAEERALYDAERAAREHKQRQERIDRRNQIIDQNTAKVKELKNFIR